MSSDPRDSADALNPHKELLAEAAAQLQAESKAREERRPKNVGQGAVGFVGDSLSGAALGAAALVMGPVQGYQQAGTKGIAGGALGGLAVGVASTLYGIGSGTYKLAHGTGKTMSGLTASKLPLRLRVGTEEGPGEYAEERARLYGDLLSESHAGVGGADVLQEPVEKELYEVLGVAADASSSQIRKAYYRMAQQFHPDKHPDDPTATEKFQKISEAYQVLSDPVKREEYHRVGASVANGEAMMDPKALFALMFSDFEHIVGDLATSTILSTMGAADGGADAAEATEAMEARAKKREEFQKAREAHLVKLLNRRLEPWLEGDEASFVDHAKHEVGALRAQPFGRDMLRTAAYIYKKKAAKLLEKGDGVFSGLSRLFEDLGEKTHSFKSQLRALEGGLKAMSESQSTTENESVDEAARREAVSTLGAVWLASVVDIERTLKHVVSAVLHSGTEIRRTPEVVDKARGLIVLAQIFEQA